MVSEKKRSLKFFFKKIELKKYIPCGSIMKIPKKKKKQCVLDKENTQSLVPATKKLEAISMDA